MAAEHSPHITQDVAIQVKCRADLERHGRVAEAVEAKAG